MTNMEKVDHLYNKYKNKVEGMFHHSLWQILVNECRKDVQSAFVYIYVPAVKDGVNVGIVDLDVSGYTPATFSIKKNVPENEREDMIDDLNTTVFGITPERACQIQFSSMRR